jgi:hypothetical protein
MDFFIVPSARNFFTYTLISLTRVSIAKCGVSKNFTIELCNVQLHLINVAPAPIFARLNRPHNRVLRRMKMFRSVLIFRRIAASHVPANHAQPQMHPGISQLYTFFANVNLRLPNFDLIHVRANLLCHFSPPENKNL